MKKIFTLISMALVAVGVNAQEVDPQGHAAGKYPVKTVVWKPIKWYNDTKNNKKDKDNNDMLYLMGTGNGYATLIAATKANGRLKQTIPISTMRQVNLVLQLMDCTISLLLRLMDS